VTESEARAALRQAIAEERPILVELTNYRRDGSRFRNAVMIAPIFGADGKCDYYIGSQMEVGSGGEDRRARAEELVAGLSPRQLQVLDFMIAGYRNKQIAGFLSIDEKTVKMHRAAMLVKLGVRSSAEGVRIGVEAGRPGGGR